MALPQSVNAQTLLQLCGRVLSFGLGFIALFFLTRALGVADYGRFTAAWAALQIGGFLVDGGFSLAVSRRLGSVPKEHRADFAKRWFPAAYGFRWFANVLFLLISIGISFLLPYDAVTRAAFVVLSFFFAFSSAASGFQGWWQQSLRTANIIWIDIVGKIVAAVAMALIFINGYGLSAAAAAVSVSGFFSLLLSHWQLRRVASLFPRYDRAIWKELAHDCWPLALMMFFTVIYFKGDAVLITAIMGVEATGIYGAAYKLLEVLVVFPALYAGLILPIMSERWAAQDKKGFRSALQESTDTLWAIVAPLVVGTMLFAAPVMTLAAGEEFASAAPLLKILMIAVAVIFFAQLWQFAVIAAGRQKNVPLFSALAAFVALGAYWIFINKFGLAGAAWVTVAIESFMAASYVWILRDVRFGVFSKKALLAWTAAFVAAALAMSLSFFAAGISWLVAAVVFSTAYAAFAYLFGVVSFSSDV